MRNGWSLKYVADEGGSGVRISRRALSIWATPVGKTYPLFTPEMLCFPPPCSDDSTSMRRRLVLATQFPARFRGAKGASLIGRRTK
jgi:hypothetical protein